MFKKKLILFSLICLILLMGIGAAYAEDNTTESIELTPINEDVGIDESAQLQSNETEKADPDFEIVFSDTFNPRWDRPEYPYLFIKMNSENLTGDFNVLIDNEFYAKDGGICFIENPCFEIPAPYCGLGNHILEVQYEGDSLYNPLNKTHVFSVELVEIAMMGEEYVLENDGITVDLPGNAKGNINLYINNEKKKTIKVTPKYDDDWFSQLIPIELDEYLKFNETYNITVTFSGSYGGKTLKASKNGEIKSVTYPLETFINSDNEYGCENTILLYTPKDIVKDNLQVIIDGQSVNFTKYVSDDYDFDRFTYYVNITEYKVGKHTISLAYSGDDKYPAKRVNDTFKISAEIKIPEYSILYNSTGSIYLILPDDATGKLTVYLGKSNETYELYESRELVNGKANIEVYGAHVGNYYLKVTYAGNYEVNNITDYTFEVQPIIEFPTIMTWGENKYITIHADNETNGTLSFFINGVLYKKVNVVNGIGKISLSNVVMKRYYDGTSILFNNSDYELDCWGYLFTVKPLMKLTVPKPSVYYSENGYYYVKFYGYNGKVLKKGITITFKIGSKTFKAKTNERGIATLKLPNTITPGTYTLRALYYDFSISTKITVKQVLSLKTVTVKKSSKKLVLTATLKKGKTAIKNKYVTFKFNGKTYKAKTNKYGTAKVTINKSVLNKLKVGKSIAYEVTYIKNKVKKTAKVKR